MAEIFNVTVEKMIDKQQVRQNFSCHARDYDRYARVQQKVAIDLAASLPRYLHSACFAALEIGCGTGLLSRQLIGLCPQMSLVLSDIAHGMSRYVHRNLEQFPVCDADAAALPFADNSFNLVASSSVYQWLNDLPKAFAETARVLQPGGLLLLAMFGENTLYELRSSHQAALADKSSHGQSFPSLEAVSVALGDGFDILSLRSDYEIEWHAAVPDLLRSLKKIGAQNASRKRPQGLASRQVMQKMMTHYKDRFGTGQGIPATYEVVYLLARHR